MVARCAVVGLLAIGCVPADEGACVWSNGACYETTTESCAEDDEVQGGSTFYDGETCNGMGCEPNSSEPNEAWHTCEVDTGAAS
ncbi:MAG: hypothetical protein ABMA64_04840 [Myxococcota bacterium]